MRKTCNPPNSSYLGRRYATSHYSGLCFLRLALLAYGELQVVGKVSDGLEAVEKAQHLQPDLILSDIGLPKLNGIEAARRIREVSPDSRVLFVSESRSHEIAKEALGDGAGGYLVKSDAWSELLPGIKTVLTGKRFYQREFGRSFPRGGDVEYDDVDDCVVSDASSASQSARGRAPL